MCELELAIEKAKSQVCRGGAQAPGPSGRNRQAEGCLVRSRLRAQKLNPSFARFWNVFFKILNQCPGIPFLSIASSDCDIGLRVFSSERSNLLFVTSHFKGLIQNPLIMRIQSCWRSRKLQRHKLGGGRGGGFQAYFGFDFILLLSNLPVLIISEWLFAIKASFRNTYLR